MGNFCRENHPKPSLEFDSTVLTKNSHKIPGDHASTSGFRINKMALPLFLNVL